MSFVAGFAGVVANFNNQGTNKLSRFIPIVKESYDCNPLICASRYRS